MYMRGLEGVFRAQGRKGLELKILGDISGHAVVQTRTI